MSAVTARKATGSHITASDGTADALLRAPAPAESGPSPVHILQARLEQAVFDSFSAKEQVSPASLSGARTIVLVTLSAMAGWGLLAAGMLLTL